jgi:hypothetical protein
MNGVLVDTSVWVDHFRNRNEDLVNLVTPDLVLSHPLIVTVLACGAPPEPRPRTLADVATLIQACQATPDEVRSFSGASNCMGSDVAWSTWLCWRRRCSPHDRACGHWTGASHSWRNGSALLFGRRVNSFSKLPTLGEHGRSTRQSI